jgi:elongation factor P--beta-lysine ligase
MNDASVPAQQAHEYHEKRAELCTVVRNYLLSKKYAEMIVPILSEAVPFEAGIDPIKTESWMMATSPESFLKQRLAQSQKNVFGIGTCFRHEQVGPYHMQEFLMAEWYRFDCSLSEIMRETQELLTLLLEMVGHAPLPPKWQILSLAKLTEEKVSVPFQSVCEDEDSFFAEMKKRGYEIEQATWEQLFHQFVLNEIEPLFPNEPFFLTDYPHRLSALCAAQKMKPWIASRFEVFVRKIEYANGNEESFDVQAISDQFKNAEKQDTELIHALESLQKTGRTMCGVGLGIDRILLQEVQLLQQNINKI